MQQRPSFDKLLRVYLNGLHPPVCTATARYRESRRCTTYMDVFDIVHFKGDTEGAMIMAALPGRMESPLQ